MSPLYYIHGMDVGGFVDVKEEEWPDYNERGYDVFWCRQEFKDNRRLAINLTKMNYVNADFDNVTMEQMISRLQLSPSPTKVVQTRSGFHLYWKIRGGVFFENFSEEYKHFIDECLIPLGADPQAKDVSRVLRVPGSRYWQDSKKNRYEDQQIFIKEIYDKGPDYTWNQLRRLFKRHPGKFTIPERQSSLDRRNIEGSSSFWERANSIKAADGLRKLSGLPCVNGQQFNVVREGKIGRIIINSKPSNAWIDEQGKFGSLCRNSEGIPTGGTLVNWLSYEEYGNDLKKIAEIMKTVFGIKE